MQKVSQVVFYFKIRNFERFSLTRRCLLYNYKKPEIRLLSLTVSCWLVFSKVFSDSMWFGDGSELDLLITIWTDSSNFLRKKQEDKLKVPTLTLATLQTCLCIKFFTPPPLHPRAITYFRELGSSPAWESHSLTRWLIRTKAGELPRRSLFWGNVVLENHYSL